MALSKTAKGNINHSKQIVKALQREGLTWAAIAKVAQSTNRCLGIAIAECCIVFDQPPTELVLDFDAPDDPVHGHQENRFFHGS